MKDVYPYTPRKTDHEKLERYFVARHDLLEELLSSLRKQAKAESLQHWMILGSRGLGKSHLAALLYHRIKNTPALHARWIPLLMDEEEPEVFSLATLLARIVAVLAEELRTESSDQANEVLNYLNQLRQSLLPTKELYEDIVAYLEDFTNLNKKRIVVFLENTDDLFTKSLKSNLEIKTLRNMLLQKNFILFIATSPTFFERIEKQKEPLYGLFRLRHLELLDFEQSMDLMRRWAEEAKNNEMLTRLRQPDFRIRVLNHLTGGNPRLLLFLYLTLSSQKDMESAAETFGKLLEHDLTGFYLSRMRDIPEQAKPVVVTLAKSRTNLTQKEIAGLTFIPIKSMGTHINRLEKSGLVRAFTKKSGKNTLYGLTDHLFRLWHQWRTGWREREIIQALIEFLAIWYREKELVSLADGQGMSAWYARHALKYRYEEEFQLRLELLQKEGMADLTELLQQGDYQGFFHLVESLSDFGLDIEPWIKKLEEEIFNQGSKEYHAQLLTQWENKTIKTSNKPQENNRKKRLLQRIRQLGALLEISKGRPIVKIPIKEIENYELANLIGQFKLRVRDFFGAEEAFKLAVELNPDASRTWYFLGITRGVQDNFAGAEEALQRAVTLNPNDVDAWYFLGRARGDQGNFTGAEEALQQAVELKPDDFSAWLFLGGARGNQDNFIGAEDAFQQAVKLKSNDSKIWYFLGGARFGQENFTGAEEALRQAVKLKPDDFNAWYLLGRVRIDQENFTGAEEALRQAVKLKPDDFDAWYLLGRVRGDQDNYIGAEEALQQAVKSKPDDFKALCSLGSASTINGNLADAEEALRQAVKLKPDNFDAWFLLGLIYYDLWKLREAHKTLLKAIRTNPGYTEPYANLVELHILSKGRMDALKRLDKSLQLKKIEAYVRAALHLFRAFVLTSEENQPAAIQALKNAQKWIDKLDHNAQAEQRQSILASLMDSLRDLILPETWQVVESYLMLMSESAPKVHKVIGRLEYVVRYYKELEFELGEKDVNRDKAAKRALRILDRLPSEERGPIEKIVKKVAANIERWRKATKTNETSIKNLRYHRLDS